jgi:DNA-binding CsgD family transcriptional regulator
MGTARWFTDPGLAEQTLGRAVEAARAAGDDAGTSWALVNLGSGAGEIRQYAVAERALREAIDWGTARDLDRATGYATAWLARCLFERGEWAEATRTLATAPCPDMAVPTRIVRLTTLGRLRARRGDPGAAEALSEAWTLAERTGDLQRLWPAAAGRAGLAWLSGRPDAEVSGLVASTYELAVRLGHPWAIGELGQWLRAGEPAPHPGAAAVLAEPEAAEPYRLQPERAALAWERFGCPYEAASALALAGELASGGHAVAGHPGASRQAGDRGAAGGASAGPLLAALRGFERLGARPAADRVAARLRSLGVRPPRRATLAHPSGLTERETEVLALVREGHSNAEIAARLSISAKTVDHHVSAILGKLGARTRREAAQIEAAQIEAAQHSDARHGEDAEQR